MASRKPLSATFNSAVSFSVSTSNEQIEGSYSDDSMELLSHFFDPFIEIKLSSRW